MMPIKHYALIQERSPEKLVSTVTKAIAKGFIPAGGISVTQAPPNPKAGGVIPHILYAQAMVKPVTPADAYGLKEDALAPEEGIIMHLAEEITKAGGEEVPQRGPKRIRQANGS